jgi:hypothetical protein
MIPAICIDGSNKPKEVQIQEWINEGAKYHITHVFFHPKQGIQGCALNEVRLSKKSSPYEAYRLSRFCIEGKDVLKLIQMIKDCSELDSFDISELIKESELHIEK